MTIGEKTWSVWLYRRTLRSPPGQNGMAHPRRSWVSNDPIREGRKGCVWFLRRVRTESSHRARRSASSFVWREDFSTTLRANGAVAEGSEDRWWTKKTVPMAPLPSTFMALRLSISSSGETSVSIFRRGKDF